MDELKSRFANWFSPKQWFPPVMIDVVLALGGGEIVNQILYPHNTDLQIDNMSAKFKVTTHAENNQLKSNFSAERDVLSQFLRSVRPSDIIWDIGANQGLFTCFSGNKLESGSVIAFEPHPHYADLLRSNIAINDISGEVQQVALGMTSAEKQLLDKGGGTRITTESGDYEIHVVPPTKICDKGIPLPNILKIDVEGAELEVIKGAKPILSESECREIYCEIHIRHDRNWGLTEDAEREMLSIIENSGFEIKKIRDNPDRPRYFIHALNI